MKTFSLLIVISVSHLLGAVLTVPAQEALSMSITASGPSEPIQTGAAFDWRIIVRWFGASDAVNPKLVHSPIPPALTIVRQSTVYRTGSAENRRYAEKIFVFTLQTGHPGQYTLQPASVEYTSPENGQARRLRTDPYTIQVTEAPLSLFQLVIASWRSYFLLWVIFIIVCVSAIGVTLFLIKRRKDNVPPAADPTPTPIQEALNQAHRARIEGDLAGYAKHLEQAVGIAMGDDTNETLPHSLQTPYHTNGDAINERKRERLDQFLITIEQAKYSPVTITQQHWDQLWNDAMYLTDQN